MPARQTILIVEDDVALRRLYRTALSFAGFDVQEAGDGFDALKSLDSKPPDLVVLDLALPALSGHVVCEELAAQAHTRDIPVVIVTGSTGMEIYQLEADRVLTKPISPDRLVEVVRRCLAAGGATTAGS
jgi:DNA-binding response OmpR family regulator